MKREGVVITTHSVHFGEPGKLANPFVCVSVCLSICLPASQHENFKHERD